MIEHGEGSESRRLWVLSDGLINLIMLKVYSGLTRNGKDYVRMTKPYNADRLLRA